MSTRARKGRAAERVVVELLVAKGFDIVGRNVRLGALELDVVARRGPLLIVVEVRTRGVGAYETAFASVSALKRRRLREATARLWRQLEHDTTIERVRIDCAAVDLAAVPVTVEIAEGV